MMDKETLEKCLNFIDSWLEFRFNDIDIPGFAVAISYKNKLVFNKAYGYANLERKEKLTPNHVFRIASHSKTFTATAIMQLAEEGKLNIDDCVSKYLPWISGHKDKRFQKITLRALLSHKAGVIRDGIDANYWLLLRPFPDKENFKKEILEADLIFNDERLKYSNFGFGLLGLIIEEASGLSYNDYVKQKIIRALGLKNTGPEYKGKIKNQLATGYSKKFKKRRLPIGNINAHALSPATGFYSTGKDICRYFEAQFIGSGELISDDSKREMHKLLGKVKNTKEEEGYGLGFVNYKVGKKWILGHSGAFPGYQTNSMFDEDKKTVVTVLTNMIDGQAKIITKGIFSIISQYEKNGHSKTRHNLSKFQGRFMHLWSVNEIVTIGNKIFCVWPDLWNPFDEPEELKYVNGETLRVVKAHSYSSEGELVNFNFNKDGKVSSIKYTGAKMLPVREYIREIKKKKIIKF